MYPNVVLQLLESFFRHPFLHLLPVVLAGAVGVSFIASQEPEYESVGVLGVQDDSLLQDLTEVRGAERSFLTPAERTSQELVSLFRTDAFVSDVAAELDLIEDGERVGDEVAQVLRQSVGIFANGSTLVAVAGRAEEPEDAAVLAEATMTSFVDWKRQELIDDSTEAEEFLDGLVDEAEADLTAARDALQAWAILNPDPVDGERPTVLQVELDALQVELSRAEANYEEALDRRTQAVVDGLVRQTEAGVRVLDQPLVPDEPTGSLRDDAIVLLAFLVLGGLAMAAAVGLGAVLDTTVRFATDVQRHLGLEVLSVLPEVSSRRLARSDR